MPTLLARKFTKEMLADEEVQAFSCGTSDWEIATANWLKNGRALESSEKHGTEVWLYYSDNGQDRHLVGYGAVGKSRRRWPSQADGYQNLSIIPQIALQSQYLGQPSGCVREKRYSHQIISDLVSKSRRHKTDLIILEVHKSNVRALKFYQNVGFELLDFKKGDQLVMAMHFSQQVRR